jgi:hypothetical protein
MTELGKWQADERVAREQSKQKMAPSDAPTLI